VGEEEGMRGEWRREGVREQGKGGGEWEWEREKRGRVWE
jgi:hypothetical protein